MAIRIITDSSIDFPEDMLADLNVTVVPLNLLFGDTEYKAGVDIDTPTFYQKLKQSKELPKSSAPSPQDFLTKFEQSEPDDKILVISLSKALSTTYENAVLAKQMFHEEHPNREVEVINSNTASSGLGIIVCHAAEMAQNGESFEDVVRETEEYTEDTLTMFLLDTLENVIKGGRLDRVKGTIASALNIKLLMRAADDGSLEVLDKVRGNKRAIRQFIQKVGEYGHNLEDKVVAIAHSNCEDKARALMEQIQERYKFKRVVLSTMGPLIGTYAGEGGLLVAFKKN
ncbi:DegV family protein [Guptibacillus algicola]|uniref:DegV family protein n=1 Tax=Guptibacillus algicola TaxID=225844 RepID=UPI001CD51FDC|nr:DegV family protein [Alkalihalobacillus algicola]MCA0989510.1 DegV family protein [Alkalihalobacillus algicola]